MPRGVARAPATGYSLRLGPIVDAKSHATRSYCRWRWSAWNDAYLARCCARIASSRCLCASRRMRSRSSDNADARACDLARAAPPRRQPPPRSRVSPRASSPPPPVDGWIVGRQRRKRRDASTVSRSARRRGAARIPSRVRAVSRARRPRAPLASSEPASRPPPTPRDASTSAAPTASLVVDLGRARASSERRFLPIERSRAVPIRS